MSEKIKIALDRGHGDRDPGAVSGSVREVDLNTNIVLKLKELLEQDGRFEVFLTCPLDKNYTLYERASTGKDKDFLISNHFNSGGGSGFEVWTEIEREKGHPRYINYVDGVRLANIMVENMKSFTKIRGVKQKAIEGSDLTYYGIIRDCPCPAILIENAFVDTPDDVNKYLTAEGINTAASLQYDAILEFFRLNEQVPQEPEQEPEHWAQKHYDSLIAKGITINDMRFDDVITRGEVFALLDRIVK